ncbi:MAG TPA: phage tail assembly chaperone [Allosphingosinicella sp.]
MFSDSAARLAGLAGAVLGWRPADFWRSTPAELAGVLSAFAGDEPEAAVMRLKEMFPDG